MTDPVTTGAPEKDELHAADLANMIVDHGYGVDTGGLFEGSTECFYCSSDEGQVHAHECIYLTCLRVVKGSRITDEDMRVK